MTEFTISSDDLRRRKLMICIPAYGAQLSAYLADSLIRLERELNAKGIPHHVQFIMNESLISRARNYLVASFIDSDCTHMLFIDSDISFAPESVVDMLIIADPESQYNIVCGAYPKKTISWEKVKRAVDKGYADKDPTELESFVGDYVINTTQSEITLNMPIEVNEAGTGFMMITRNVFEKFTEAYPEMLYTPDHKRDKNENFNGSKRITAYFMDYIDKETDRHLSEDYMFCRWCAKIGIKTWILPWINLNHIGNYTFKGEFAKILTTGMAATL